MTFFLVASGASLTIGIGLSCLTVTRRDVFRRDARSALDSRSCDLPHHGGEDTGHSPRFHP
jgi:hypothetical protein